MPTQYDDAIRELDRRLAAQGLRARLFFHDDIWHAAVHHADDAEAQLGDALPGGHDLVEAIAADLADDMGLPSDWLHRVGMPEPVPVPTHQQRFAAAFLRYATRVSERCGEIARRSDVSPVKQRLARLVLSWMPFAVRSLLWLPGRRRRQQQSSRDC